MLAGIAKVYLRKLQSVQNAAVRMVSAAHQCDHISPVLEDFTLAASKSTSGLQDGLVGQ